MIKKKVRRVIQFNQEACPKPYIDMNTKYRKSAKNDFEKDFFKLMNNAVFGKTMENVRRHRDIKLVKTDKRKNRLVSKPNYHTRKWFSENLLAIEMKKTKVKMNKPIFLGLSILEISKTLMHEFWYDYMEPKYGDNVKLCYMDTDSFIMHIKTEDFYKDIANDVEKKNDTSNYEVNRPLPTGKNKNVIGLMKDKLGGKIVAEFVALRPKTYSYILVTGDVAVVGGDSNTEVCFKNCNVFTRSVIRLNDEHIETAENLNLTMNLYNLVEYSDNYEQSLGSLWQYKRDEQPLNNASDIIDVTVDNLSSFKHKSNLLKGLTTRDVAANVNPNIANLHRLFINAQITLPLK